MGATLIEKIISDHSGRQVQPGDIVDIKIDARLARDFGGANVVKNIENFGLGIDDPDATFFTFDCNPTGSDQRYAANQQRIRLFAADREIKVYDITEGIGTHVAIDEGLIGPGSTMVSTDSHANIVGAIGAFGQGMGDQDIAQAFARGKVWFKVPRTVKIVIEGRRGTGVSAKDITLALLKKTGASGLLGFAAEVSGKVADEMNLAERITLASMATEMAGIIIFFTPNDAVLAQLRELTGRVYKAVEAEPDAHYDHEIRLDVTGLEPLVSLPGNPANVALLSEVRGTRIHSAFIGSCTDGRYEDMAEAADILAGRSVAPGVVLKIVPATDKVWQRCLKEGILDTFKSAGALVGNAGCAGCAAGQIGQNGPDEVTISTGNRNFPGKQGQGKVYLASPAVVAASAVKGMIVAPEDMDSDIKPRKPEKTEPAGSAPRPAPAVAKERPADAPLKLKGRVWMIDRDNIDTDMIYHNRHLAVTEIDEMGRYCFGNLEGWTDFAEKARPGDIVVTGGNFGCGSSRQHAVDCFKSLGVSAIVARSFGAIYERNAINAGLPILEGDLSNLDLKAGDVVCIDLMEGDVSKEGSDLTVKVKPFSQVQLDIYKRGGLLNR